LKYQFRLIETISFILAIIAIALNQFFIASFLTIFGMINAYILFAKGKPVDKSSSLINEFASRYTKGKSAIKSLASISNSSNEVVRYSLANYWLSGCKPRIEDENKNTKNLLDIAFLGASTGVNISKGIELLKDGIEKERQKEEKVEAKAKGMNTLSKMGVTFFFPLFSGISINIIKSSLALSSNIHSLSMISMFSIVSVAYTAIILFIGKLFSDLQSSITAAFCNIMPFVVVADWILKISSTFLSSIL